MTGTPTWRLLRNAALVVLLLAGNSPAVSGGEAWISEHFRDNPLVGRIWSLREGRFVAAEDVFGAAAKARFLLLGETHPNADHHLLQAKFITEMAERGRRPDVVLEMISRDLADDLDAYQRGGMGNAAGLGAAVRWEERGWPSWSIYQPIAEAAFAAGSRLHAGDVPKRVRKMVAGKGIAALTAKERARLRLDVPLPEALRDALLDELFESHCELLPREALRGMVEVQRLRDATMAEALIEADRGDGAVLISGAGHVRGDRAVPWYLRQRRAGGEILVVAFREVEEGEDDVTAYLPRQSTAFDFLWFTPRSELVDHCAELKKRFEKKDRR